MTEEEQKEFDKEFDFMLGTATEFGFTPAEKMKDWLNSLLKKREEDFADKILNGSYKWVDMEDGTGRYINFNQLENLIHTNKETI